jgi:hypothetical protein
MEKLLNNADLMPVFLVIGVIVLAQFGTIVTIMIWLAKSVWWAAQQDLKTKRMDKDLNQAFRKIRGEQFKEEEDEGNT